VPNRLPIVRSLATVALLTLPVLPGCIIVSRHDYSDEYSGRRSWNGSSAQNRRIGIEIGNISDATAAQAGVNPGHVTLISGVIPGSPADKAGLREWDIIAGIDGRDLANAQTLRGAVDAKNDGETLTLTIVRTGQRLQVVVGTEKY
jgi:S1-C subfamily serine protease